MSSERVTIDLIVNDELARGKLSGFLAEMGQNAKLVQQPIQGWGDALGGFQSKLMQMTSAGGVMWQARKLAMEMRDAYREVQESRLANLNVQSAVSKVLQMEVPNAIPVTLPGGGQRAATKQEFEADVDAARRLAGGGVFTESATWMGAVESSAGSLSRPEAVRLGGMIGKTIIGSGMPTGQHVGYATALTQVARTGKQRFGWSPEASMGFLDKVRNASLVNDPAELAETFASLFVQGTEMGLSAEDLGYLYSYMTQVLADIHGSVSNTAATGLMIGLATAPIGPGGKTVNLGKTGIPAAMGMAQDYFSKGFEQHGGKEGGGFKWLFPAIKKYFKMSRGGRATLGQAQMLVPGLAGLTPAEKAQALAEYEAANPGETMTPADREAAMKGAPTTMQRLSGEMRERFADISPEALEAQAGMRFGPEGTSDPGQQFNLDQARIAMVVEDRRRAQERRDSEIAHWDKLRQDALAGATSIGPVARARSEAVAATLVALGAAPETTFRTGMAVDAAEARVPAVIEAARALTTTAGTPIPRIVEAFKKGYAGASARRLDSRLLGDVAGSGTITEDPMAAFLKSANGPRDNAVSANSREVISVAGAVAQFSGLQLPGTILGITMLQSAARNLERATRGNHPAIAPNGN